MSQAVTRHVTLSALLEKLQQLEIELHQATTRANAARLMELLHADFQEFGRSGKVHSRSDILAEFAGRKELPEIHSSSFEVSEIGDGTALLTYVSAHLDESGELTRHTLRSSLWVLVDGRWRMRFHQGTPTNARS